MAEFGRAREISAVLATTLVAGIGVAACGGGNKVSSSSKKAAECKTIDGTTGINLIGASKEGGVNAVNTGECVGVYNPDTLRSMGTLAHGEAFVIKCVDGPKPAAYRIDAKGIQGGDIDLDTHLVQDLHQGALKGTGVRDC